MALRTGSRLAALLLVAVVAVAGCGGAAVPEPPAEYVVAMASLETAVAAGDGDLVEYFAFEVSQSLIDFRETPGVPLPMRADLNGLSAEVASFGVRAATSGIETREWIDLHSRISRVTQGEPPTEGPRYQSSFPPEVVEAVAEMDDAVADGNPTRANAALQDLNGAFWAWVEKAPPQLVQNAYDVAEQIDVLAYSASLMTADEIAEHWGPIRSRLRI